MYTEGAIHSLLQQVIVLLLLDRWQVFVTLCSEFAYQNDSRICEKFAVNAVKQIDSDLRGRRSGYWGIIVFMRYTRSVPISFSLQNAPFGWPAETTAEENFWQIENNWDLCGLYGVRAILFSTFSVHRQNLLKRRLVSAIECSSVYK